MPKTVKSVARLKYIILTALLSVMLIKANALDIQKGTYYFNNSLTNYQLPKFVYGSDERAVTYVVSMTDEGNNLWSVTFHDTVTGVYRYVVAATSMDDGVYNKTFTSVKDYISLTLNESRTITSDTPMPVGWVYTPTNNEKWASAEWRQPGGKQCSGTLPVVYINTEAPVNSKDDYVGGTCYIDNMGLDGYESMGSADQPLVLLIKGHGNYTWKDFSKKPYRLKFNDKVKPFGMKKNRHFVLMANADDNLAFLRNEIGMELSRRLGLDYTSRQEPVELVLNGDYLGLYMLAEKIRVGKNRVNIDEQADKETHPDSITGGWLIEIDNYSEPDQVVITEGNGEKIHFSIHSPELLSTAQRNYITRLLTDTDKAIYANDKTDTTWEKLIDIDALARFYIVQEIMDNAESFHGSCFIHKQRGNDTKLVFGPVWDFGNAFRRGSDKFVYQDPPFGQNWIGEIARFPRFQQHVIDIWRPFLGDDYPSLDGYIEDFISRIGTAAICDAQRWPNYGSTNIGERKRDFKQHISQKVAFLTKKWGEGISGIEQAKTMEWDVQSPHNAWFTLDGRRLNAPPSRPGIYLHRGRKVVVHRQSD